MLRGLLLPVLAVVFCVIDSNGVHARQCYPISSPKAPFWRGLLKNFIPSSPDRFRPVLSSDATAFQQCIGSMDVSRWQMRGLAGNKPCIRTMSKLFKHNDILSNVYIHHDIVKTMFEHILTMIQSFKTDRFDASVAAFRAFQSTFPVRHFDETCQALKSDILTCVAEQFLPVIEAKFLRKKCCDAFQSDMRRNFGRPMDMAFIKWVLNTAHDIMCTRKEDTVCIQELAQTLLVQEDMTPLLSARDATAMCALNNQQDFNLTAPGETYRMNHAIGCCAERIDSHLSTAQKAFPMLQTDFFSRFFDEQKTVQAKELPEVLQYFTAPETAAHLPLGFASSCTFDSKCTRP